MAGGTFSKRGGVAVEGLHPAHMALQSLSRRALTDLLDSVPASRLAALGCQTAARRSLQPHETRVLLAMRNDGDVTARTQSVGHTDLIISVIARRSKHVKEGLAPPCRQRSSLPRYLPLL